MGWGQEGARRGGSTKSKPIPAPPRGAGLKSRPIPAPPPLRGGKNSHGAKQGGAGQAGRVKIAIPSPRALFRTPLKHSDILVVIAHNGIHHHVTASTSLDPSSLDRSTTSFLLYWD